MLIGQALIDDVNRTDLPHGQAALWWLGQHSFILKLGRVVIYLEPYLSPNARRTAPPFVTPQQVTHAQIITGSHDHADHIDRPIWPALAAASPDATFLVPQRLLDEGLAASLNIAANRFTGLDDLTRVEHRGITITGIAAAHEQLDTAPDTGRHAYIGFVIEGHGVRLYHSGDTTKYEGLESRLRQNWDHFDAVMLPINGRDARRYKAGCIGNMTYQEAVDLAGAINARIAIPTHYDMFWHNSANPNDFVEYLQAKYPHVTPHICHHATRTIIPPSP